MGDFHEIRKIMTAKEIAKNEGVTVRAINERWKANFHETPFDCNALLSPEQVELLSRKKAASAAKKAKRSRKENAPVVDGILTDDGVKMLVPGQHYKAGAENTDYIQPAPAEPGAPDTPPARQGWRLFDLPALLAVVIYAHTLLVWYEIATIFVMPGVFAGVILAAMKHAAVVVVRSGKFGDAVYHVLGIAFLLDALAWYVHFTAFFAALRESRYMTEMGQNSYAVAGVLAAVVCSGAFVALFLIHKIKSQQ